MKVAYDEKAVFALHTGVGAVMAGFWMLGYVEWARGVRRGVLTAGGRGGAPRRRSPPLVIPTFLCQYQFWSMIGVMC